MASTIETIRLQNRFKECNSRYSQLCNHCAFIGDRELMSASCDHIYTLCCHCSHVYGAGLCLMLPCLQHLHCDHGVHVDTSAGAVGKAASDRAHRHAQATVQKHRHIVSLHLTRWWWTAPTARRVGIGGHLTSISSSVCLSDSTTNCNTRIFSSSHLDACRQQAYSLHY